MLILVACLCGCLELASAQEDAISNAIDAVANRLTVTTARAAITPGAITPGAGTTGFGFLCCFDTLSHSFS